MLMIHATCLFSSPSLSPDAKKTLRDLDIVNNGRRETASHAKLRKLTAPKVEYYHEIQKTNDRQVDRTARAIIETPERIALRKQKADDKIFTKTVEEATALYNTHAKWIPAKAPPKLSLY